MVEKMSGLIGLFFAFAHNNSTLFTHPYRCLYARSGEWSVEKLPPWCADLWQLELSQTFLVLKENMLNVIPAREHTGAILKHSCAYLVQHSSMEK